MIHEWTKIGKGRAAAWECEHCGLVVTSPWAVVRNLLLLKVCHGR